MPIAAGEFGFRYSAPDAAAGNTLPHAGPISLGRYVSTTTVQSAQLHNVFGPVEPFTGSPVPEYACLFVTNLNTTYTVLDVVVWFSNPFVGDTLALAVDNFPASDMGSETPQASLIGSTLLAPDGVSDFSSPILREDGLSLGDVGPGQVKAIWVRRTATQTLSLTEYGVRIRLAGTSV